MWPGGDFTTPRARVSFNQLAEDLAEQLAEGLAGGWQKGGEVSNPLAVNRLRGVVTGVLPNSRASAGGW